MNVLMQMGKLDKEKNSEVNLFSQAGFCFVLFFVNIKLALQAGLRERE